MRKDTKHRHLDYSYSPISHSQVLHSQTLFIIDVPWYVETKYEGSTACCGAADDLDVQRSASQTGAMMNQNHTGIGSDSRNSGNKKLILGMLRRAISLPIMFILPFSFLAPGAFMKNLRSTDYWATALLLTVVAIAGHLTGKHGTAARIWDQREIGKGQAWTPQQVYYRSDHPHLGQDKHEVTNMKKPRPKDNAGGGTS